MLDVIRQARSRASRLSLFRCNDEDDLRGARGGAVDRGVDVEVLVTSRAKGGKKKQQKLWKRARSDRRRRSMPTPIRS